MPHPGVFLNDPSFQEQVNEVSGGDIMDWFKEADTSGEGKISCAEFSHHLLTTCEG